MSNLRCFTVESPVRRFTLGAIALFLAGSSIAAETTERVSLSSTGAQGNSGSLHRMAISGDARFVAFQSDATNLVANDTNDSRDIFVRDRATATTSRISLSSAGVQANHMCYHPTISADGRFVAFESYADNLVAGDTNNGLDVFLHDRVTGETTRRSVSTTGAQANGISHSAALSADGRWLAFVSTATNLATVHPGGISNVFLHDRLSGATTIVSQAASGDVANDSSWNPSLSSDGRSIAFASFASNLLPSPTNGFSKIYVRDRVLGTVVLASPSASGVEVNGDCRYPQISASGRAVAFQSMASNLVATDTNGLPDLFVRDFALGVTELVSVSSSGAQSNGSSDATSQPPGISADGRFVAFACFATNLVPNPTGFSSVYLRDRFLQTTTNLAVTPTGGPANNTTLQPAMSADGRFVAFQSAANDLVSGDTNSDYDVFLRGPFASPWTDLGKSLMGMNGTPILLGAGTLTPASSGRLDLTSARASSPAICFIALGAAPAPLACGTLVPLPYLVTIAATTDAQGTTAIPWTIWPSGLSGLALHFQYLIADPAAACGVAFSNALRADPP